MRIALSSVMVAGSGTPFASLNVISTYPQQPLYAIQSSASRVYE